MESRALRRDRILVVGAARSGTSWLGRTIGKASGTRYYGEPDNFDVETEGKKPGWMGFGPYPVLAPGDEHPSFEALWDMIFTGRMPKRGRLTVTAGRLLLRAPARTRDPILKAAAHVAGLAPGVPPRTVVKSIYAVFAVEWLAHRYRPIVVVIQRNPRSVVSSWLRLGIDPFDLSTRRDIRERYLEARGLEPPPQQASQLVIAAWCVGLITTALAEALYRHPEWVLVTHEDLCSDPQSSFRAIFERLGLAWTADASRYLAEVNRPGAGLRPFRVASEQPDQWKARLDASQVDEIDRVLAAFPSRGWVREPEAGLRPA